MSKEGLGGPIIVSEHADRLQGRDDVSLCNWASFLNFQDMFCELF